mmetsp:Transcript_5035/g.14708  ORF Transcript_5035/g.14708 Transcript_5035/m.14708 type:complete len:119 (+) Transcript_5035:108-464(+)
MLSPFAASIPHRLHVLSVTRPIRNLLRILRHTPSTLRRRQATAQLLPILHSRLRPSRWCRKFDDHGLRRGSPRSAHSHSVMAGRSVVKSYRDNFINISKCVRRTGTFSNRTMQLLTGG